MKIVLRILLIIISALIIIEGSICIYEYLTKETEPEEIIKTYLFTIDTYPRVDVLPEMQLLAMNLQKEFTGENVSNEEYLEEDDDDTRYNKLIDGEVDLILDMEPSDEVLEYAEESDVELEIIPFASKKVLLEKINNKVTNTEDGLAEIYYYIVIRKDEPEDGDVRRLVNALLSKEGQRIVEKAGYIRGK